MAITPPTVVQSAHTGFDNAGSATVTVTFSGNVTKGNGILFVFSGKSTGNITPGAPNGSDRIGSRASTAGTGGNTTRVWWMANFPASGVASFNWYFTAAATGHINAIEISGAQYAEFAESAGSSSTAPASDAGGTEGDGYGSTYLAIGVITNGSATANVANLSGVTAAYSSNLGGSYSQADATATFKIECFSQTITSRGTDPSIAGTLSTSNLWAAVVVMLMPAGRGYVLGWEGAAALSQGTPGVGQKRTGSGGAQGNKVSVVAGTSRETLKMVTCSVFGAEQVYWQGKTLPAADMDIIWGCNYGTGNTPAWKLRYITASGKLQMEIWSQTAGHLNSTQEATQLSTNAVSSATWYRLDVRWSIDSSFTYSVEWWIDGVAQTTVTFAQPTTGSKWVCGVGTLGFGHTASNQTFEFWYDDCVTILNPNLTTFPFTNPASCYMHLPNGIGTNVNGSNFRDDAAVSPPTDYTKLADEITNVSSYFEQKTLGGTDYIELTLEDTAGGRNGPGTLYVHRTNVFQGGAHIVVGGDEFYGVLPESPHGGWTSGVGGNYNSSTNVGYLGTDVTDSKYTSSQWDSAVVRIGYDVVTANARWSALYMELTDPLQLGGDHWGGWGWSEGADSSDSWRWA